MPRTQRAIIVTLAGVLSVFALQGCAAPWETREPPSSKIGVLYQRDAEAGSPCRDSLFLALRARPPDLLDERELRYVLQKDRECAEYQRRHQEGNAEVGGLFAGLILGGVLGGVLMLFGIGYALAHAPW